MTLLTLRSVCFALQPVQVTAVELVAVMEVVVVGGSKTVITRPQYQSHASPNVWFEVAPAAATPPFGFSCLPSCGEH